MFIEVDGIDMIDVFDISNIFDAFNVFDIFGVFDAFDIPNVFESIFYDKCKHAKSKPLSKNGPTTGPTNYRAISLLPLVSKISEKVIHDVTIKYLTESS